jgi:hypothetical protein
MFKITRRDIEHGYDVARRTVGRVSGDYDPKLGGKTVGKLVETGEVMGSAFLVGLASGRYGPLTVGGTPLPMDLGAAVFLHGANMLLDTGRLESHITNVANGTGAAWATKVGVGAGTEMRRKRGLPEVKISGQFPVGENEGVQRILAGSPPRRRPFSEAELMGLANQVR